MIHLTYENLDAETQESLIGRAKNEIEREHGPALKMYAKKQHITYGTLLEEEAIRRLYTYKFRFTI